MKRIFAAISGLSLLVVPTFALAQAIPLGPTPLQLLTAVATLEAQAASVSNSQSLACAALFSAQTVAIGQPVALAWGSFGAVSNTSSSQPSWTPEGATYVTLDKAGTWTYQFAFYGAGGASTMCTAKVTAE